MKWQIERALTCRVLTVVGWVPVTLLPGTVVALYNELSGRIYGSVMGVGAVELEAKDVVRC